MIRSAVYAGLAHAATISMGAFAWRYDLNQTTTKVQILCRSRVSRRSLGRYPRPQKRVLLTDKVANYDELSRGWPATCGNASKSLKLPREMCDEASWMLLNKG